MFTSIHLQTGQECTQCVRLNAKGLFAEKYMCEAFDTKKIRANLTLAPLALNVPCELYGSTCKDFPHLCRWFIAHEKVICHCREKMKPILNRDNGKGV